jgi:GT2 family glycosyltransferase
MKQPIRIFHPASPDFGIAHYRIIQPAVLMKRKGMHIPAILSNYLDRDGFLALNPDSVVFQSQFADPHIQQMQDYRKWKPDVHIGYELNDVMWDFPEKSIVRDKIPFDIQKRLELIFSISDTVICSNERLAKLTRSRFHTKADIVVAPNGLSRNILDSLGQIKKNPLKEDVPPKNKPRIGWAGGENHVGDLALISSLVNRTKDKYQWVFFGIVPPDVDPRSVEVHSPVKFHQYLNYLSALDLDVALAPLEDHVFNTGKSDLRIIEYSACNFPVVASNVPAYQNTPALLVENREEAWERGIEKILSDPDRKWKQVRLQKEYIEKNAVLENQLDLWNRAWGKTDFHSEDVNLNRTVVAVSSFRIQKSDGTEIPSFRDWDSAQEFDPDASVLWLDSQTWISPETVDRLLEELDETTASVSPLSNRGDFLSYPKMHQINPGTSEQYQKILEGVSRLDPGTRQIVPNPTGCAVLFSNKILKKIGRPRFDELCPDGALSEWGSCALLTGFIHKGGLRTYAVSGNLEPISQEDMQKIMFRLKILCPEKQAHIQEWSMRVPDFLEIRKRLDIDIAKNSDTFPKMKEGMSYTDWVRWFDSPSGTQLESVFESTPEWEKFGIVCPVYKPNMFDFQKTIQSVRNQVYKNWNLVLVIDEDPDSRTSGLLEYVVDLSKEDPRIQVIVSDRNEGIVGASNRGLNHLFHKDAGWIFFLDNEDTIPPHALVELSRAIRDNPYGSLFYTDSDLIDGSNRQSPFFKPGFDYERLLSQNYFNHLTLYRASILKELNGLTPGTDGAQDYDLVLRYLEKLDVWKPSGKKKIVHIPRVLYHWRASENSTAVNPQAKPEASERARTAVLSHLSRRGLAGFVGPHPALPMWQMVRYLVEDEKQPKVSIIIPFKDQVEMLERCLISLLSKTSYKNYEILLVNNGSKEKKTKRFLEAIRDPRIRIESYPFSFNWSRINNFASDKASGSLLLFLNNDIEIAENAWLTDMVATILSSSDIGTVGARLIYGNGSIQHIGVHVSNKKDVYAYHYGRFESVGSPGYFGIYQLTHEAAAVTGACMLVDKDFFESSGKFDESLAINYGDVEYCLRTSQKHHKRHVVCMQAVLFHHESMTRRVNQQESLDHLKQVQELQQLNDRIPLEDPYWNPNHLPASLTFNEIEWPPKPFFWEKDPENRPWAVSFNGEEKDWANLKNEGYRVLALSSEDSHIRIDFPSFENWLPWNKNLEWKDVRQFVDKFSPEKTVFYGLKGSSQELLFLLLKVFDRIEYRPENDEQTCPWGNRSVREQECDNYEDRDRGISVTFSPDTCRKCIDNNGSPYGFVDPDQWRLNWNVFLKNVMQIP